MTEEPSAQPPRPAGRSREGGPEIDRSLFYLVAGGLLLIVYSLRATKVINMDKQNMAENMMKIKRPMWQIAVLIIFSVIGIVSALPCLCPQGTVKGLVKSMLFAIVLTTLLFGLYKNNLTIIDIVIWMGAFFVFCFGIEIL